MNRISSNLKLFFSTAFISILTATLIISRNALGGFSPDSTLAAAYYPLALSGQAYILHLLLMLVFLLLCWLPRPLFRGLAVLIMASLNFTLLLDSQVYQIYRFHLDIFFIKMFFMDINGMGVSYLTVGYGVGILLAMIALFYWISGWSSRMIRRRGLISLWVLLFLTTLSGQFIHAWGYAHSTRDIVAFTQAVPWYQPLTANDDLKKMGLIDESVREHNLSISVSGKGQFHYPAHPLSCRAPADKPNIMFVVLESWRFDQLSEKTVPNIYRIGQESLVFSEHLSGGDVTDHGLFSLLYGTSPIYREDALGAGSQPAIIEALKQQGYQLFVQANQDIKRTKTQDILFRGITPIQNNQRGTSVEGDQKMVPELLTQIDKHAGQPFFSFLFFNSTHYRYPTPAGVKGPYQPAEMMEMSSVSNSTDPLPYRNQYYNAGHFLDGLVGQLRQGLEQRGLWDNTIIVITGDHGEEFNESHQNYWGHGSNFSRYQLQVPLVIHWPGRHGVISHRTSHEDITPTLIRDALGCSNPVADISTGASLFDNQQRTVVARSYVNTAIVQQSSVNELYPGYISVYDFYDKNRHAESPAGLFNAVQQIKSHFRK